MRNLFNKGMEEEISKIQKENAMKSKAKSVLEAFEYIVELAENSKLNDEFFDRAGKHIRYAARKI